MNTGTRFSDALLPAAVVTIVAIMVFPLPTGILDILLSINISFALCLLISVVYLKEPEKFTALPTILLLSTLFRLGLNISTTRVILSRAQAPEMISTFGNFVAYGNLIVGLVIFAIITLVQFLVIAKGAERVAEVAARFTLDAMPGKQMSIDADVRSGILSVSDARVKRIELEQESKLYGSLDGAMKFVKGDAIAGIAITMINIFAGLFVGVSQFDLSLSEAASKYTLFTIGDGLVSQIPALLVAVSAGIAVTRVNNRDGIFVGRDMVSQLSQEPQALGTTALVLLTLSLVPGLSFLSFICLSAICGLGALIGSDLRKKKTEQAKYSQFVPKVFSSLTLILSTESARLLQAEGKLTPYLQELRKSLFDSEGILIPDIQFELNPHTAGCTVTLNIHGIEAGVLTVTNTQNQISDDVYKFVKVGIEDGLSQILNDTHTRLLLESYQPVAEDLINSVTPQMLSITELTLLLRQLIEEGVSIKEFPVILQTIAEFELDKQNKISGEELLTSVRIALKRSVAKSLGYPKHELRVLKLDQSTDALLSEISVSKGRLNLELATHLIEAIKCKFENTEQSPEIFLASRTARRVLADVFLASHLSYKAVCAEEISLFSKVHIIAEVGLHTGAENEHTKQFTESYDSKQSSANHIIQ